MVKKILHNRLLFILIHISFGYLATLPIFPKVYGVFIIIVPLYIIYLSKNKDEEALIFSSYIVGSEVFLRMTNGFVLYETGKYAVILFLILGVIVGQFKQRFSVQYVFYILLLLLGIIFTQVPQGESIRKAIVFNLSGPVVLGIAAFYFYNRVISKQKLLDALFFILLPLFSTVTFLFFRTPDLVDIVFNTEANFVTSGGFGPNQVATAIGLGIFILTIFVILKERITGYLFLDYIFLIYFIYRGLLTFSRGGIITAVLSLVSFYLFYLIYNRISLKVFFKYIFTATFFIFAIWIYTSEITGGMLNNRYSGKNTIGQQKDITSGRLDIFEYQVTNFIDNPLGIGVGNGKYHRQKNENNITASSHNEVGRLLEEHGFIGLFLLLILLITPLFNFFRGNNYQRAFIISFYVFWFLTINHSALRIALPGFIYSLSLVIINFNEED